LSEFLIQLSSLYYGFSLLNTKDIVKIDYYQIIFVFW